MLWEKQKTEEMIVEGLEKQYENIPELLTVPDETIVILDGKKGMWSLNEVIILLQNNEIRFKIVL